MDYNPALTGLAFAKHLRKLSDRQLSAALRKANKASEETAAAHPGEDGMCEDDWHVLEILGEQERRKELPASRRRAYQRGGR